jgi:hypothetical protein
MGPLPGACNQAATSPGVGLDQPVQRLQQPSGLLRALWWVSGGEFAELALLAYPGDGSGDELPQRWLVKVVGAAQLHVPVHLAAALEQPGGVG